MRDEEVPSVLRSLHERLTLLEARAPTGGRSAVYSGGRRFQYARERESAIRSVARPSDEDMLKHFLNEVERLQPNGRHGGRTFAQIIVMFWRSNNYRYRKNEVLSEVYGDAENRKTITSVWNSNASDPFKDISAIRVISIMAVMLTSIFQTDSIPREVIFKCFLDKVRELMPSREIKQYTFGAIINLFWRCKYYLQYPEGTMNHFFSNNDFEIALLSVWESTENDPLSELEPGIVEDIMDAIWTFTFQPPAH